MSTPTNRTVPVRVVEAPSASNVTTVAIDRLIQTPLHRRSRWGDLDELGLSISKVGIIQPLVVREADGNLLEVVAGERRRRAAIKAKLAEVPVVIRRLSDEQVLEYQLHENQGRADLHPLDEADLYKDLTDRGRSVESIATLQGVDLKYVRGRMRLCTLPQSGREAYLAGQLTDFAAFAIARIQSSEIQEGAVAAVLREQKRGPQLSDTQVTDLLRRSYVLPLASAPWSLNQTVGDVAACKQCPKRTLAQRDLFDDFYGEGGVASRKDDFCTDVACWKVKSDAHWADELRRVKGAGCQVLGKTESAGIWAPATDPGRRIKVAPGGAWVDSEEEPEGGGGKTWQTIATDQQVVLARDPDGHPRYLLEAKPARRALGKLMKATRSTAPTRDAEEHEAPDETAQRAEKTAARKARREAEVVMAKLIEQAAGLAPSGSTSKLVEVMAIVSITALPDAAKRVARRYTVDPDEYLRNARNAGVGALTSLLVEVMLDEAADQSDELSDVVVKACRELGVDTDRVIAAAKGDLAA